jgi:DNA-binding MarR family transcriptional regulator
VAPLTVGSKWSYFNDVYTSNESVLHPCVCTTTKKLSRVLGRAYDASLAASPMNVTQLAVLRSLQRRSNQPLTHIAQELEMDRTSLYRALTPMRRQGWIRLAAGTDARSQSAQVTPKGRQALQEAVDCWKQIQLPIVRKFGQRRWSAFIAEMQSLANVAKLVQKELPAAAIR